MVLGGTQWCSNSDESSCNSGGGGCSNSSDLVAAAAAVQVQVVQENHGTRQWELRGFSGHFHMEEQDDADRQEVLSCAQDVVSVIGHSTSKDPET
jgi:hypothetical protein